MYDPGELDQRVIIREEIHTPDGMGGNTLTFSDIATVWTKVKPRGGREDDSYDRINAEAGQIFIIRNRDMSEKLRLVWQGIEYNITNIKRYGTKMLYLEIEAERGVAQ